MRHLWSLLAGVVIAPLGWAVIAFGQAVIHDAVTAGPLTGQSSKLVLAGAAFAAVGLVVGTLACLRISPVGPLVISVFYLASTALLIFSPKNGLDVFDRVRKDLFGHDVSLLSPLTSGVIAILGAALLMAVFSGKRWRSESEPEATPWSSDWKTSTSGTFADLTSAGASSGGSSPWGSR
ncbi:MAG: hypothetical protein HOV77_06110 [Hamadaea sp.]|uniref:hypothetical protein n=1 Tax=Hamadaea sp. TaxID=2024425 RepID=UPI0017A95980|nr:hypothetical protein [Hamadaea sp.]NUT18740.1 hypothetical protein [Hamadaea sp.]